MSEYLLKAHLKFMVSIPAIMIFAVVYSYLYSVISPEVCKETGIAPSEAFLFEEAFRTVFPEADGSELHLRYEGWFFSKRAIVTDGKKTLEFDSDINYGSFFNRGSSNNINSDYLLGPGYYEIIFRDTALEGYSLTLDACGVAQDDIGFREMYTERGNELNK